MIWSGGHAVEIAAADAVTRAGTRGARGGLERALPGEWAALVVTLVVIAAVGAAILVATCLAHERVIAKRRARRLARRAAPDTARVATSS
ncbi:hypothetical protein KGA66_17855 [Actinocrinis puniceicyclus]|uniref:Uncharacterized protein n=1 Tax=Actinocrinis puniceicyclus TaxID=977794 RepID=A0A8J8BE75_9ACTN|nr:hypothetical protein [Actinocrinis puniceicyclus]MBS2964926.1 hypothetical protein [Actinocrinis puniceicyclus]